MTSGPVVTTSYEWRRFVAGVLVVAGAVAITIAAHSRAPVSNSPTATGTTYTYTCCSAALVDTIYHPGQVMAIHWIRRVSAATASGQGVVVLSARLSGPFSSVVNLKSTIVASPSSVQSVDVVSPVTRVAKTSQARPVTFLAIPANAAPGYYNLSVSIASSPKSVVMSASSIVRIAG